MKKSLLLERNCRIYQGVEVIPLCVYVYQKTLDRKIMNYERIMQNKIIYNNISVVVSPAAKIMF